MKPSFPKRFLSPLILLASLASLGNRNQSVLRGAPLAAGAHIAARLIADPLRHDANSPNRTSEDLQHLCDDVQTDERSC